MNNNIIHSTSKALEVALRNLGRIHADIQFADRKASLILVTNSGFLALLWRRFTETELPPVPMALSSLAAVAAMVALGLAFSVIVPRGRGKNRKRTRGVLDSARIAKYAPYGDEGFEEYRRNLETKSEHDLIRELQELTYDYSHIHFEKYGWVEKAVWATAVSGAAFLLAFVSIVADPVPASKELPSRKIEVKYVVPMISDVRFDSRTKE